MGDKLNFWRAGVAALALSAPTVFVGSNPAHAQTQAAQTKFDIPALPLNEALVRFSQASGVDVVVDQDLVAGKRSTAVRGAMAAESALKGMLAGTGLSARVTADGAVIRREASRRPSAQPVRAAPASADMGDQKAQEEVIVTAQRRAEDGQDVPVAVTAFDAQAIDRLGLESLRDVSRVAPGLFVSAFNFTSPTIAIRGATNTFTQIGANKPVQIVLDDVFIPRNSAASFELFGLNSIQVLRGPQGTLFGRNVTGGAVLIDTGRPRLGEADARLRLSAGDFNLRAAEALIDAPLGEEAALRVTGALRQRDGFGRDRLTGREQDDLNSGSARAQLRVQLTPSAEALIGLDYGDDRNNGRTLSSIANGADGDRRTSELGVPQTFARTQWGSSVRLFIDALGGEITSITAYRESQSGEVFSNVGANFAFLTGTASQQVTTDRDEVSAFTQEVRYASPLWARGNFVVGAFYAQEDFTRIVDQVSLRATNGAIVANGAADQALTSDTFAVFADGTLNLSEQLALTLGLRYTQDDKTAALVRTDRLVAANSFAASNVGESWSEVTPRAVLSWRPTENLLGYLSYSQGYTAGGFNTDAATLAALRAPFAPETLTNTEAGFKSDWFGGRLRLNGAIFQMDYQDKQELFFNNVTRILNIVNAAEATMRGAEVEASLDIASWLNLEATYAHLDTTYDNFVIPGGANNTDTPLGSSPEHRYSIAANAQWPVGAWGEAFATAAYAHTSEYFTGAGANPGLLVPQYGLLNLSAGLRAADDRWRLTAFVRNAEDTEYLLTPSVQTVRAEYLGEPRTAGVTLELRY